MLVNTQVLQGTQVPVDYEENLILRDFDTTIADYFGWEPVHVDDQIEARSAIIHAYLYRGWGETEAFNALVTFGLFGDLKTFMETYSAGVEAIAARLPSDPSPLPPCAPGGIVAPSMEFLEAVVGRRVA